MARPNSSRPGLGALLALALCSAVQRAAGARPCTSSTLPAVVNGAFPASCNGATGGQTCTAVCQPGYTSSPPVTTCNGATGRWSPPSPASCARTCSGMPIGLDGGFWPPSCNNSTPISSACRGQCGGITPFGNPAAQCPSNWVKGTDIVGRCSHKPVCSKLPPRALNGAWGPRCLDTAVNGTCTMVCQRNYLAAGSPTTTCLESGEWAPVSPPACAFGTVPGRGAAFVVNYDDSNIAVCSLSNGTFQGCMVNNGFFYPLSIAVVGTTALVIEDMHMAAVPQAKVCRYDAGSGTLSRCRNSSLPGYFDNGLNSQLANVVVDPRTLVAYVTDRLGGPDYAGSLILCSDGLNLAGCSTSYAVSAPWGLALGPGTLYIAQDKGNPVLACPLAQTGLSVVMAECRSINTGLAEHWGLALSTDGTKLYASDGAGLAVCSTAPPYSCLRTDARGALRAGSKPGNVASGGLATGADGVLYTPVYYENALGVCRNSSGGGLDCELRRATSTAGNNAASSVVSVFVLQ